VLDLVRRSGYIFGIVRLGPAAKTTQTYTEHGTRLLSHRMSRQIHSKPGLGFRAGPAVDSYSILTRPRIDARCLRRKNWGGQQCSALLRRRQNGQPLDMTIRVTDVWQRQNSEWRLIHSHSSFPIDMATGKADTQSRP
jgi:hypothetical protein